MKSLVIATLGVFLLFSSLDIFRPTRTERVVRSIVQIRFLGLTVQGEIKPHICTGFVVSASRGEVLTARHCVPHSDFYVDEYLSHVIRTSETLALVASRPMNKPPLALREGALVLGMDVWAFGYAYGHMTIVPRRLVGVYPEDQDLILDGPLYPGMSGGPMIDTQGHVVGINQGTSDHYSIGCGLEEIQAFLHLRP